MNLEVARPQDYPRVVEIVNNAYRGVAKPSGWTNEAELLSGQRTNLAALTQMAASSETVLLVTRESGRPIGNVALEKRASGLWYLSMLAVDPSNQLGNLGKKIMLNAEAFAREHGAKLIQLSVIAQRASLIAWYERRGYNRTGQTVPFPYEDPSVGTPLRNDLALVILEKALGRAAERD
ncbi:GNAT family N-acetyltransferase [Rhizobium tubonense]|nr:GNAT family N-acetyltransferase [Rhizobium tubonense]